MKCLVKIASMALVLQLAVSPAWAAADDWDKPHNWKHPEAMAAIPASARALEAFVPKGWRIEQRVPGHLDGDAVRDMVLVLRQADPANIRRGEPLPEDVEVDLNPRIVLGLLKTPAGYRVVARNDRLIPAPDSELVIDPLDEIVLEKRTLKLTISFFATMGTYYTSTSVFYFRLDDECLHLTRYEDVSLRRNAQTEQRKVVEYAFRDDIDPSELAEQQSLKPVAGPCFEELGDAWETQW